MKLVLNPYEPNHKAIGPLRLMVHAPLKKVGLTKHSPPKLKDMLTDESDEKLRTVNLSFIKPHIEELEFNLDGVCRHKVHAGGKDFLITLLEIGEEEHPREPGRKYLYFYFEIQDML
ncbi:MAG: hypothetical protein ACO1NZ_05070 [Adhaeribacter sp.]